MKEDIFRLVLNGIHIKKKSQLLKDWELFYPSNSSDSAHDCQDVRVSSVHVSNFCLAAIICFHTTMFF